MNTYGIVLSLLMKQGGDQSHKSPARWSLCMRGQWWAYKGRGRNGPRGLWVSCWSDYSLFTCIAVTWLAALVLVDLRPMGNAKNYCNNRGGLDLGLSDNRLLDKVCSWHRSHICFNMDSFMALNRNDVLRTTWWSIQDSPFTEKRKKIQAVLLGL